jgi:hypothetical protein
MPDSLYSNRAHVLSWLDATVDQLTGLRQLMADGTTEALGKMCEEAIEARRQWLLDRRRQFSEEMPMPSIEKPNLLHQILPRMLLDRR